MVGFNKIKGISYKRLKAVSREIEVNSHGGTADAIRSKYGEYRPEYRLVREKKGYIWRNTISDTGISGHHKTVRSAIISALWHVTLYADEAFSYTEFSRFEEVKKWHENRYKCRHFFIENRWGSKTCTECGIFFIDTKREL